jgi:Penicillin binding protein transpeptidase domain
MEPLTRAAHYLLTTCSLLLLFLGGSSTGIATATPTQAESQQALFSQSLRLSLDREFRSDKTISYLLFDADSESVLAGKWPSPDTPIPPGSLVKPFTALAYAASHNFRYPVYECRGKSSGCWQPNAHGNLNISSAISVSCNSYFRQLAQNIDIDQARPVLITYGLDLPAPNSQSIALVGIGDSWKISPRRLAHAYLELARRRNQPGVPEILEGMRESALRGTGAAVGPALAPAKALVKTGTAPCTHSPSAPADGFVVVLLPADQPQVLLVLRVHGGTGAKAAEAAARALRRTEP